MPERHDRPFPAPLARDPRGGRQAGQESACSPRQGQVNRCALGGIAAAILLAGIANAADAAPAATPKRELRQQQGELRGRIDALRRDLTKSEESRADAAERLRETESAISTANRELRRLAEQQDAMQAELRELESQSRRLADQTAARQQQLSRLLYRQFIRGEADALSLLLGGRDPNQAALDHQFLKRLSIAQAEVIADLRDKTREKQRLGELARAKGVELAAVEQGRKQARTALVDQQRQRRELLAKTADRIKAQRRQIGALQQDEQRLAKLVETLGRTARKPPRAAPPAARTKDDKPASNRDTPDAATIGGLATLKGKLALPVSGDIIGRFGRPRPEGGLAWKGLFIKAAEGTEVKAVAAGQVVHADWLRGYGNLMVLDHGDGFLSVYGNNESLLKDVGQSVKAGEVVATVGNTGGNPESGLYFELRQQGQAFDPLRWVNLR
jgi:septal ring factor EnvC (AmiA/AmiB activator)